MKLTIAAQVLDLTNVDVPGVSKPSHKQQLKQLLKGLGHLEDSPIHTLEPTITIDGYVVDVDRTRSWLSVGSGDSAGAVSDVDVLRLIANGGAMGEISFMPEMMRQLPNWDNAVTAVKRKLVSTDASRKAKELQLRYVGKRGLMVLDVVASRQRRYDKVVVPHYLEKYKSMVPDLGLSYLKLNSPDFLKLTKSEPLTLSEVAGFLLGFDGHTDEEKISNFKAVSHSFECRQKAIAIKGIGEVLYEYLRILSGADSLKVDVRVREQLWLLGIPVSDFTDSGLLNICRVLAADAQCTLVELDQALWNDELKGD